MRASRRVLAAAAVVAMAVTACSSSSGSSGSAGSKPTSPTPGEPTSGPAAADIPRALRLVAHGSLLWGALALAVACLGAIHA